MDRSLTSRLLNQIFMVLILLLMLAESHPGLAKAPLIDVKKDLGQNINQKSLYFLDQTNQITIQQVMNDPQNWQPPASNNVVADLPRSTFWVQLNFRNGADQGKEVALELNPIFLERIILYDHLGNMLYQTGSTVEQLALSSFPTLNFTVPPKGGKFYISVESRANTLALMLWSKEAQRSKVLFDMAVAMLLVGSLLGLLIYHLFMFISYKNKTYLSYVMFLSAVILFTITFTSFHHAFLPSKILGFGVDFWWSAIAAPIFLTVQYLFSINLLGLGLTGGRHKVLSRILLAIPVLNITSLVGILATDNAMWLIGIRGAPILNIILLMGTGFYLWFKERSNKVALYYSLSWIPFNASIATVLLWLSGALDYQAIFTWSIPIGSVVQTVLLSFVAGKKQKEYLNVIRVFAGSDIVEELDKGHDPLTFKPRMEEKNIVFFDLREFSALSERMDPKALRNLLNSYFSPIISNVYKYGGKVEKIIGDALMITFDDAKQCLNSIVETRFELSDLNRTRVREGQIPIRFGTAISSGQVLLANFGSKHKIDRTVTGDIVNTAARLEGTTKSLAVDVLCTKEFLDKLGDYEFYRPGGYVLFKGMSKKSLVYELFQHNSEPVREWKISTRSKLFEAVELELTGDYKGALTIIHDMINQCPEHTYIERRTTMDPTLEALVKAIHDKLNLYGIDIPEVPSAREIVKESA